MKFTERALSRRAAGIVAIHMVATVGTWAPCIATAQPVKVVNVIPLGQSMETAQNSEPNIAVNPRNPLQIAASAHFRGFDACMTAPIFLSEDGGVSWEVKCILPTISEDGPGDITLRFSGDGQHLYAGMLRSMGLLDMRILKASQTAIGEEMTEIRQRDPVDQPYVRATTIGGNDLLVVTSNDLSAPGLGTAAIDVADDAGTAVPAFNSVFIEKRWLGPNPATRATIHPDGKVYAVFYSPQDPDNEKYDVVVVRHDPPGSGGSFGALREPVSAGAACNQRDGELGIRVAQCRKVPYSEFGIASFGNERLVNSHLSIEVDPNDWKTVYVAWADEQKKSYVLHVSRSTDGGVSWPLELRMVANALNPALAINSEGTVGFLYQQLEGRGSSARWVTRLELSDDGFSTRREFVLANVKANDLDPAWWPYLGDYLHLMAVGTTFYGVFSASNYPDKTNFPNDVAFLRNSDFVNHVLLSDAGTDKIDISIDPFFFKVEKEESSECATIRTTKTELDSELPQFGDRGRPNARLKKRIRETKKKISELVDRTKEIGCNP